MTKSVNTILFLILGTLLIWLGLNGKLGVFLASLFTPKLVKLKEEDGEEEDSGEIVTTNETIVSLPSVNASSVLPSGISRLQS